MKVAALTMVYNEAERLPRWLGYYGSQLGPENLIVLDHGSDDGSTRGLAGPRVRSVLRAATLSEDARARLVSRVVGEMLGQYDWVIYTDVDEFLVPFSGSTLTDFLATQEAPVATALGFSLLYDPDDTSDLATSAPLLEQRPRCIFDRPECKTLATKQPIRWSPGFHFSDQPMNHNGLLLFHTRYADRGTVQRQAVKNRAVVTDNPQVNLHWKLSDEEIDAQIASVGTGEFVELTEAMVTKHEQMLQAECNLHHSGLWTRRLNRPPELTRYLVPEHLRSAL